MVAQSRQRVPANTAPEINQQISHQAQVNLAFYRQHPERVPERLAQLDGEWDIERALETGSATLSLLGLGMALVHSRRWLLLPLAVQSFFLQHALQGWCPPLPALRRLGFRTVEEIEEERRELLALRP